MAASYSRLYEGKVDHINCPHPPPNGRGGANQRPRKMAITGALYSEASGRMGGPKVIKINYLTTN